MLTEYKTSVRSGVWSIMSMESVIWLNTVSVYDLAASSGDGTDDRCVFLSENKDHYRYRKQ